jgi:UDPglucose--hexose-1-phosphate uridylyltransferase
MTNNVSTKRWHPFLGEWVIIAPVTSARPLDSRDFSHSRNVAVEYDQNCYLCPGTKRASGIVNPQYKDVFVFDNDFASLSMSQSLDQILFYPLDSPARGICRVVCFSRRHNTTLA